MAPLPWIVSGERAAAKDSPFFADVSNRPLRALLSQSGYDPDADPFPGLYGPVFNARAFGAVPVVDPDDTIDSTQAFIDAHAEAQAVNGMLYIPYGIYRYSAKIFDITNKVGIIGAGKRQTFLKPLPSFHDYAITITNCWRNGAEGAIEGSTTLDTALSKAGVHLEGFTIIGDRTYGGNRGIQSIGTNDFLTMRDIDFVCIDGTGLQLGQQSDAGHTSCVRECFFENIQFELSGNLTEPAFDLAGGADGANGDGSNDLWFFGLNFANNKGIHWRIQGQTSKGTRGINAYGIVLNGDGPEAGSPTPADLIQILGNCGGINLHGLFASGSATVASIPYAAVRVGSNAAGTPDRIKIHGDVVSMLGDAYVLDKVSAIHIGGTSGVAGAGVTELKVAAGQQGSFNLQYDVISQQGVVARQALISIGDEAAAAGIYGSFRQQQQMTAVNDATPDVRNVESLLIVNTVPTPITDFDFGGKGQLLPVVIGNADVGTTLVNGALILRAGRDRQVHQNETLLFRHNGATQWLEIGDANYQVVDGWTQDNVAASQTNVELARADGRFRAVRAGSITGIVVTATEARTAGTLTIKMSKNTGLAGGAGTQVGTMTAVLDGTNPSRQASVQKVASATFAAGDELYITVTTDAAWTPNTSDIRCALEVVV